MILFTEFINLLGLGDQQAYENEKHWQSRREYLIKQSEKVSRWIIRFDPSEAAMEACAEGLDEGLMQEAIEMKR
jgi:hypothetical protein